MAAAEPAMIDPRTVPIPDTMRELDRDRRGYAIPTMVYRDKTGRPHFAINQEHIRQRIILKDCCGICGKPLTRFRWFVGGPAAAFHPAGAYLDPPMHAECADYALRVCPYLAAPRYAGLIDARTLDPEDRQREMIVQHTTIPDRPAVFVAVLATGSKLIRGEYVVAEGGIVRSLPYVQSMRPRRPQRVEFWRAGERLDPVEGLALCHGSPGLEGFAPAGAYPGAKWREA